MSRCFPFPPPGYEKKARTDETDLLKKEKQKDIKHTEEKDKRKREAKENKDKERNKERHKDKKDRKEKRRDNKNRDKDKGKTRASDEKRDGQPECCNGEILVSNNLQHVGAQDCKFVLELDRRNRIGDNATRNHMVQKITAVDQRMSELPGRMEINPCWDGEKEKINCKREDDKKANGHHCNVEGGGSRRVERTAKLVENDKFKPQMEGKERSLKNSVVQNCAWMGSKMGEGTARAMEKDIVAWQMERKDKNEFKENASASDKNKDKSGEKGKESKTKDKGRDETKEERAKRKEEKARRKEEKAKRKEEKAKRKEEKAKKKEERAKRKEEKARKKEEKAKEIKVLNQQQSKLHESGQDEKAKDTKVRNQQKSKLEENSKSPIVTCIKPYLASKESGEDTACENSLSKRKELEINGVLHDSDIRPSKLPRPILSSTSVLENGKKEELRKAANNLQTGQQVDVVKFKEQKINGLIRAQQSAVCSTGPVSTLHANDSGWTSGDVPHPDSGYLELILTVPRMAELSDFDNQEWLFTSKTKQTDTVESVSSNGVPEVWAEAVRIGSADVSALPYVIPY